MATPVAVSTIDEEGDVSLISWGAVIAGGLAAAALTLLLLAFGVGIGLSVVSPWASEGVSATTFQVGTGAYLIVVAMLASTVGGLIAGACAPAGYALIGTRCFSETPRTASSLGHSQPYLARLRSVPPRPAFSPVHQLV